MDALELKFANAFNSIPNVGGATARVLKKHFGNLAEAWKAGLAAIEESGIEKTALQGIAWKRASVHPDREMEKLVKENIWLMDESDDAFPSCLREIPSPPYLVYGKGEPSLLKQGTKIAVVGTRKPTAYGLEAAEKITRGLCANNLTIVSGLALGIDSKAHETALEEKGKTVAVLGSGIDYYSLFPMENRGLARRVIETGGVVLSEYSPGTPAVKEHFPQRNRIISGLSKGVIVIEAKERSGALITARLALEQNREVFAIPGPIFSLSSAGPNNLIKQGAKAVTKTEDVLEELGLEPSQKMLFEPSEPLDQKEWIILQLLEEPLNVDTIKEKSGLETPTILAALSMLELKGRIKNVEGVYAKT